MRWCVWFAVAGCNQVFGLEPTQFNAALDDAGPDAPGCSGSLFGNAQAVAGSVWGGLDYDPSTNDDPTELWHTHDTTPANDFDIRIAMRGAGGSYDTAVPFTLNTTSTEQDSNMTADGLVVVWVSDRVGSTFLVYGATRATRNATFDLATNIAPQVSPDEGIDLSIDGLRLYFADVMGNLRLAARTSRGTTFGAPGEVLSTNCHWPSVSPDELELFCERFDAAKNPLGIFRWVRTSTTQPWPATFDTILSGSNYYDPEVSPDSKRLYYSTGGELDMMTRTCN